MNPIGAEPPSTSTHDRETPLGRDGSGSLALVAPAAAGLDPQVLKRFDPPAGGGAGRVRLAQRLWRLVRLALPTLPGLAVAQTRPGAPPACWVAAADRPPLGPEPRLGAAEAAELLAALVETLGRAHQGRVAGLRFRPEAVVWHAGGPFRWLAPDLLPAADGPAEADRARDLAALAQTFRGWLAEAPAAEQPLGRALAALEAGGEPAYAVRSALEALGGTPPTLRLPVATPLLCRELELAELGDALQLAAEEYRLVCVRIVSPEGAFLDEVFDTLAAEWGPAGVTVLAGRCRGVDAAGAALRDVLGRLRGGRGGEPSAALRALETPPAEATLPALPPAAARVRLFRALDDELRRARGHGPLVLALTAVEQADDLTTAWVDHLVSQDAAMPVLLLLAGDEGPDDPRAELTIRAHELEPLEIRTLAQAYAGGGDAGDPEALWEATDGQRPRLHRWIQRRLLGAPAHLPEGVRELLRAFATLGGVGEVATLHALMEMPDAAFFELLERALDGGWLLERGGRLAFVVPEDLAAIQAEMAPGDALRWHRRLAALAALPPAERVRHALVGGPEGLAPSLALAAVRHLLALGAAEAAAGLADAAIAAAAPEDPARGPLSRALAYMALMGGDAAAAEARAAAEEATDDGPGAAWLVGLARLAQGDPAGAEAALARATEIAEDAADRGRLLAARAGLAADRGDGAQALGLAAEAVEARAEAADPGMRAVVDAEVRLVVARVRAADPGADVEGAAIAAGEALAAGEAAGHADVALAAATLQAHVAGSRERMGEALEAWQRARGWAEAIGRAEAIAAIDVALAATLARMGMFEAALGRLPVEPEPGEAADIFARGQAVRAVAALYLGYVNDPMRRLDQALARAREDGGGALLAIVHAAQARALAFLGKTARAAEVAAEGLAIAEAHGARGEALELALQVAEAAWRQGDDAAAEAGFAEVMAQAEATGRVGTLARALLGHARVEGARGGYAAASGDLAKAWDLAEAAGLALVQAEVAHQRGELLRATGDLPAAAEAFGLALARADAIGSPHHRALALAGLGATTADPGAADAYRAQAVAHLTIFLEQLGEPGRRDFLAWPERAAAIEPGQAEVALAPVPAARAAAAAVASATAAGAARQGAAGAEAADEVLDLVTAGATPDALIARLNDAFRRIARAGRSMAYMVNEAGEARLRDRRADPEALTVLGPETPCVGVVEQVLARGQTVWVPDVLADPAYRDVPEIRDRGLRGVLCVPIKTTGADGTERVLGCLYGDRLAPWQGLTDGDVAAIGRMARHAAVALRNAMLEEESRRKTERLELLGDLTRALAGTLDVDRLLALALRQVLAVTRGEQGYVFFGPELACRASMDREGRPLPEVQVSRSVIARVTRDRQPLTILDVGQDEELQHKASLMIRNVRSVMCVPLVLGEHLLGLIYVGSSTANKTFGRHDLDVLIAIASQVALMLQNAQAYETIKELNVGLEAKVQERTQALEGALRELTETQAQLLETEKLATVGTLAAGVAHEINNPLGAVLTNAQLLRLDLADPDQVDSLAMIEEGARRCMEIVQALLKYSKPPQASYAPIDMRAITEDTLAMVERQRQLDGIDVRAAFGDVPGVLGDPAELRQVVVQLLLNAADAIRERAADPAGTIRVDLRRELAGLVLTVADDGVGMATEVQRRVFDPFFTTKGVGAGTGLGLSVCRRVIEKHGGRIQFVSAPGAGTTFTVVLPVP